MKVETRTSLAKCPRSQTTMTFHQCQAACKIQSSLECKIEETSWELSGVDQHFSKFSPETDFLSSQRFVNALKSFKWLCSALVNSISFVYIAFSLSSPFNSEVAKNTSKR